MPFLQHCGRNAEVLERHYIPSSPEFFNQGFPQQELTIAKCSNPKCLVKLVLGWRLVNPMGFPEGSMNVIRQKHYEDWRKRLQQRHEVRKMDGVDWVWGSETIFPFTKRKVPVL